MNSKLTLLSCALLCSGLVTAAGAPPSSKPPLTQSDTIVWAGLDYSLVRMIGHTTDTRRHRHFVNFAIPDLIFPTMLEKWNALFLEERLEKVAHRWNKQMLIDLGGVTLRNKTASSRQIITEATSGDTIEKSHITQQTIADEIRSYKLEKKSGLGLVFIVDRLVISDSDNRPRNRGAVYVVCFDIATREVLAAERKIAIPGGSNFRNYWFGVIKRVESDFTGQLSPSQAATSLMPVLRTNAKPLQRKYPGGGTIP
jgi:hypothetical protein